jgi:protein-disulfide reductase (glutathione)
MSKPRLIALGLIAALLLCGVGSSRAGGDWNDGQVSWRPYEDGLAEAKKEKKPVCLVFFTEWCPHCKNYSGVFHDEKVVERAKKFVMIRLDQDKNAELGKKYQPDGGYIPRTFFLKSDGTLEPSIHAPRTGYVYFYNEKDPAPLVAAMDEATAKLK